MNSDGIGRQPSSDPGLTRAELLRVVILATTLNLLSRGCLDSFTVFLLPLQQEFDAPRASVAAVYSVGMFATGGLAWIAGILFDKIGPLRLNLVAFTVLVASLAAGAFAQSLWQLYICIGAGVGIACAWLGNAPQSALLTRWFEGRRLTGVMGLIFAGNGLGTLLIVPMAQYSIQQVGWRDTYLLLAAIAASGSLLLFMVPWTLAEKGRPRSLGRAEAMATAIPSLDWTVLRAMREPAFWGLAAIFGFTGAGMYSVMAQAVTYLIELGQPPLRAASIYGVIGVLTPIGILGFAWADGRIGRQGSAALSYFCSLSGMFALWLLQFWPYDWLILVFLAGVGLSFGARGPLVAATAAKLFQGRRFGSIYGFIMMGSGLGTFAGTFIGALLHDITGGYSAVFAFSGICLVCGSLPFWTLRVLRKGIV